MAMSDLCDEAQLFQLHLDVFAEENDCDCIMDAISESQLIDAKVLDVIRRIPDSQSKNRFAYCKVASHIIVPWVVEKAGTTEIIATEAFEAFLQ